ncbi:MAG TPA: hypothetical protein VM260_24780 [Pirellula sp.]|nr:hypothetical protein [Pirellula sp.]
MAELLVRNVDEAVAQMLQQQAMAHGISQEEEHRRILSQALMGSTEVCKPMDFKEFLLSIPDVGEDSDFSRIAGNLRDVDFSE